MGRRVLVVDDDRDAADSLSAALRSRDHDARVAYDGASAIDAARAFRPEFAFLDLRMPGMDGYQLAWKLRRVPGLEGICIVGLTGYADWGHASRGAFDRVLLKPAAFETIQAIVEG